MSALRSLGRKPLLESQSLIDVVEQDLVREGIPAFVDRSCVASITGISAMTAWRKIQSGELRAFRPGGRGNWKIRRRDLAEFIARSSNQA